MPSKQPKFTPENDASRIQKGILVIEDDSGIREMLQILFELEGYEVTTASNGREGLDALSRLRNLGLIFLDLMMPVMNGWEFIEALKKTQYSNIPVVVVTAYPEQVGDIEHRGIVKKPIDINTLLRIARKWCEGNGTDRKNKSAFDSS